MIRTVQITPTRVLVAPPMPETSNSVTRRYKDKLDAIIRVQFRDEGVRLHVSYAFGVLADIRLFTRRDRPTRSTGASASCRVFAEPCTTVSTWEVGDTCPLPRPRPSKSELAPGARPQLTPRDHAMWFICYDMIDREELLSWMGTVSETVVAKHAARMGLVSGTGSGTDNQPFSATRSVNLDIVMGEEYPDIERNGHCFTDGCSIAGIEIMRKAAAALGDRRGVNSAPSAIQFRLG